MWGSINQWLFFFFLFLMCCARFKLVNVQICQDISSMVLNSGTRDLVLRIITTETRDRWSALLIFVDHYLGWITALVTINYLQFACSVELCGSLLWLPTLPIQCPALLTPHRKWVMVGIGSGKFLQWSSFSVMVLVGGCLKGWFLPWNLPAVTGIFAGRVRWPLMAPVPKLINYWWWV